MHRILTHRELSQLNIAVTAELTTSLTTLASQLLLVKKGRHRSKTPLPSPSVPRVSSPPPPSFRSAGGVVGRFDGDDEPQEDSVLVFSDNGTRLTHLTRVTPPKDKGRAPFVQEDDLGAFDPLNGSSKHLGESEAKLRQTLLKIAFCHLDLEEYDAAKKMFTRILRLWPEDPLVRFQLARMERTVFQRPRIAMLMLEKYWIPHVRPKSESEEREEQEEPAPPPVASASAESSSVTPAPSAAVAAEPVDKENEGEGEVVAAAAAAATDASHKQQEEEVVVSASSSSSSSSSSSDTAQEDAETEIFRRPPEVDYDPSVRDLPPHERFLLPTPSEWVSKRRFIFRRLSLNPSSSSSSSSSSGSSSGSQEEEQEPGLLVVDSVIPSAVWFAYADACGSACCDHKHLSAFSRGLTQLRREVRVLSTSCQRNESHRVLLREARGVLRQRLLERGLLLLVDEMHSRAAKVHFAEALELFLIQKDEDTDEARRKEEEQQQVGSSSSSSSNSLSTGEAAAVLEMVLGKKKKKKKEWRLPVFLDDAMDVFTKTRVMLYKYMTLEMKEEEVVQAFKDHLQAKSPVLCLDSLGFMFDEGDDHKKKLVAADQVLRLLSKWDAELSPRVPLGDRLRDTDPGSGGDGGTGHCWWYRGRELSFVERFDSIGIIPYRFYRLASLVRLDRSQEAEDELWRLLNMPQCAHLGKWLAFLDVGGSEKKLRTIGPKERGALTPIQTARCIVYIATFLLCCSRSCALFPPKFLKEASLRVCDLIDSKFSGFPMSRVILILLKQEFISDSIECFDSIATLKDGSVPYYHLWATLLVDRNEYDAAAKVFEKILPVVSPGSAAIAGYVNALTQTNRHAEALPFLERLVGRTIVNGALVHAQLMGSCLALGRQDEGVEHSRKAIAVLLEGFRDPNLYLVHASCVLAQGEVDRAFEIVDEAILKYPTDIDLKVAKADLYVVQNNMEERVIQLREVVAKYPSRSTTPYYSLAEGLWFVDFLGADEDGSELAKVVDTFFSVFRDRDLPYDKIALMKAYQILGVTAGHTVTPENAQLCRRNLAIIGRLGQAVELDAKVRMFVEIAKGRFYGCKGHFDVAKCVSSYRVAREINRLFPTPEPWVQAVVMLGEAQAHREAFFAMPVDPEFSKGARGESPRYKALMSSLSVYNQLAQAEPDHISPRLEMLDLACEVGAFELAMKVATPLVAKIRELIGSSEIRESAPKTLRFGLRHALTRRAIALEHNDPKNPDLEGALKDSLEAIKCLEEEEERPGVIAACRRTAIRCLLNLKRSDEAFEMLEKVKLDVKDNKLARSWCFAMRGRALVQLGRLNEGLNEMMFSFDTHPPVGLVDTRFQLLKGPFRDTLRSELDAHQKQARAEFQESLILDWIEKKKHVFSITFPKHEPICIPQVFALRSPKFADVLAAGRASTQLHDDFYAPMLLLSKWIVGSELPEEAGSVDVLLPAYHAAYLLGLKKGCLACLRRLCSRFSDEPTPVLQLYVTQRQVYFDGFPEAQAIVLQFFSKHQEVIARLALDDVPAKDKWAQLMQEISAVDALPCPVAEDPHTSLCTALVGIHRRFVRSQENDPTRDFNLKSNDGVLFPIHKSVAILSSKYLRAILTGSFKDSDDDVQEIDLRSDLLQKVVEFLYCHRRTRFSLDEMKVDDWQDLMKAADRYLLEDFEALCKHAYLISYYVRLKAEEEAEAEAKAASEAEARLAKPDAEAGGAQETTGGGFVPSPSPSPPASSGASASLPPVAEDSRLVSQVHQILRQKMQAASSETKSDD